jgi:hypothetical protein
MSKIFNIYCDESCHLESSVLTSENRFMVLGGIGCSVDSKEEISERIKQIKKENDIGLYAEMKWTKISQKKLRAYKNLINYFFDCDSLFFRAIVINKEQLDHKKHNHTHDEFYYKMYWLMLAWFIEPSNQYHIYLDIKDTQGVNKTKKLQEVLCNSSYDFKREIIERIQEVRSHEIILMQIVDLLIGAISYANRYPKGGTSQAKNELVTLIRERSGVSLQRSTLLGARKFNIFCWDGHR